MTLLRIPVSKRNMSHYRIISQLRNPFLGTSDYRCVQFYSQEKKKNIGVRLIKRAQGQKTMLWVTSFQLCYRDTNVSRLSNRDCTPATVIKLFRCLRNRGSWEGPIWGRLLSRDTRWSRSSFKRCCYKWQWHKKPNGEACQNISTFQHPVTGFAPLYLHLSPFSSRLSSKEALLPLTSLCHAQNNVYVPKASPGSVVLLSICQSSDAWAPGGTCSSVSECAGPLPRASTTHTTCQRMPARL